MVEKVLKLFLGGVCLIVLLKYPWFVVSALQAFVDSVVRTADAIVHLKLSSTDSGKG